VRRFLGRPDELEARLRARRTEPRAEFVSVLTERLRLGRSEWKLRLALVATLTIGVVTAFAALGGIGYAASAAKSLATSIGSSQNTQSGNSGGGNQQGGNQNQTSAENQYPTKTTICHRTGSANHPYEVITVSNNALPAHKAHGDTLVGPGGTCPGPPIQ
jgi:hypothetical protein